MDSERLSRALRDLERSVNSVEQILNRPLDEFLNDDEAVYALRCAVVEAAEPAVQIGLILLRETGAPPRQLRRGVPNARRKGNHPAGPRRGYAEVRRA